jgi:hypothetical protein
VHAPPVIPLRGVVDERRWAGTRPRAARRVTRSSAARRSGGDGSGLITVRINVRVWHSTNGYDEIIQTAEELAFGTAVAVGEFTSRYLRVQQIARRGRLSAHLMPRLLLAPDAVIVETAGAYQEMLDEEGLWRVALAWRFDVPEHREVRDELVTRLRAAVAELDAIALRQERLS